MATGRFTNIFQQTTFLNDIGHCLHLGAAGLVNILESVKLFSLLVLYDSDLEEMIDEIICKHEGVITGRLERGGEERTTHPTKSTLSHYAKENKVEQIDLTIEINWLGRRKNELFTGAWCTKMNEPTSARHRKAPMEKKNNCAMDKINYKDLFKTAEKGTVLDQRDGGHLLDDGRNRRRHEEK